MLKLIAAKEFIREEEGAALVEYALLLAFISIVGISTIALLGSALSGFFTDASELIDGVGSS